MNTAPPVEQKPSGMGKQPFPAAGRLRLKLAVRGAVQGVGFRPFVSRLAEELGLAGWVNNSPQGVFVEVEGAEPALQQFLIRLPAEKPPHSSIQSLEATWLDTAGYQKFEIRPSATGGPKSALVLPDIATCPECLHELFDPANRRYLYPFINCTHCGPRFSIIEALPYDRANTTMKGFTMCPECRAEYEEPRDRRFHAQPNACPVCGPHVELWNPAGEAVFTNHDAVLAAAYAIRHGKIVAVKGVGGFHLLVNARTESAVQRLRQRKHREEKPFALLFPSLEAVRRACEVSDAEARLLTSPEAPIVLLRRRAAPADGVCNPIAAAVTPGNPNLGVMLPSNPLQHLLMAVLKFPVVATSGNLSDEPLCIDEHDALGRLARIADWFLVHNRAIVRHVDDSIVRVVLDREQVLRRARGFAPLPVPVNFGAHPRAAGAILGVGAHLKNAIALEVNGEVFVSQHIGDLETECASRTFRRVIADFEKLYEARPSAVAADLHPDYLSTRFAEGVKSRRHTGVQHHVAHVLSCMAENELAPPVLGVAWDGTGYGLDGTIWGGEFFLITKNDCQRVAHLRPFRLPGGDAAVKEPRRAAIGLLWQMLGDAVFDREDLPSVAAFSAAERTALKTMLKQKLNAPLTSSAGRLFDAVASLAGLRQVMRFEGQAAMELEFALADTATDEACRFAPVNREAETILDWSPMIEEILEDVARGVSTGVISAKFHNALAEAVVAVARKVGVNRVALSGGCFQNRYLTERVVHRLRAEGFQPYWHQRVPPNDGGIALGQVAAVLRDLAPLPPD